MNRNTMIKDLTEKINSMTEDQLEQLHDFAHVITAEGPDRILQDISSREDQLQELGQAARELRRSRLSPTEQAIAARIQHGRELIQEDIHRDMMMDEIDYLREVSYGDAGTAEDPETGIVLRIYGNDPARLMCDAYRLGFNRGYCTRSVELEK